MAVFLDAAVLTALLCLAFMAYVLLLVYRGRLRESYALIWLGVGLAMTVFSSSREWVDGVGTFFGVSYPPALFLLLGLLFGLTVSLHLTVHQSQQETRLVRLTQEVALLRQELEERRQGDGLRHGGP